MAKGARGLFEDRFIFDPDFLADHAGHIITDPRIAIIELLANSYDAGATRVEVLWPSTKNTGLSVEDNGTGMTKDQFDRRWKTFCYSRPKEQGLLVEYPPDQKGNRRVPFGRSGKGRYAGFCFADEYHVETWRDGRFTRVAVSLTSGGEAPFHCKLEDEGEREGHGTKVWTDDSRVVLPVQEVCELIGSKFLVDPSLSIVVDGHHVELVGLKHKVTSSLQVPPHGSVVVHRIDSQVQDRVIHLRGITWWVNQRMVGEPSWDELDGEGAYLDGRTAEAKRYSFVVEADILREEVRDDWSGFHVTPRYNAVRDSVDKHVVQSLNEVLSTSRKDQKKAAIGRHREMLNGLPIVSRKFVGQFVDQVLERCPTVTQRDLSRTVEILGKLEQTRCGYDFLKRLEACSPDDIDTWNTLRSRQ